ncbi:hypothetical protein EFM54_05445 [Lentilactobacillus buchneri]|uniref:hypothetical protein n=1 Tax=Lentilactobacillus buchneri TaxID=1581 RepID=UPI0021A64E89|nr:hypothetical protein [Lentilactobacillus buchneri]MCT2898449.1 hypothetical protein [Lentilactobacillus buchneri]
MIRKHIALLLAIFSFSTSAAFLQDQSVQAAKWHHGTPTALRGHWRTNVFWQYGFRNYNTMAIGKHELISTIHAIASTADVSLPTIWSPKYIYLGHHLYKFKGMGPGGFKTHCWIKWKNHRLLTVKTPKSGLPEHYYR